MRRTVRAPDGDHTTTGTSPTPARSYGRGTGVPHPVDVDVGKSIRARRLFHGMNQATLATALGLTFQQVQKYEYGSNRVSASRLSAIADVLGVPVSFFFIERPADQDARLELSETTELVRAYYAIADARVRRQFLQMIKAVARKNRRRTPERDVLSSAAAG